MRQGDRGRMVQRLGGREIKLEKLEALKVEVERAIKRLNKVNLPFTAASLQLALDEAFPPPSSSTSISNEGVV